MSAVYETSFVLRLFSESIEDLETIKSESEIDLGKKSFSYSARATLPQTLRRHLRERWFVLTRSELSYFDGADTAKKKEKGRVSLKDVRVVEPVALREGGEAKPNSFQIGYRDRDRRHH